MALAYKISDVIDLSNDFDEKLNVLVGLNEYEKLVLYEKKLYLDSNFSFMQPVTRWWSNQNRIYTINYLEEEITTFFNFLTFVRGAHNSVKTANIEREQLLTIYEKHLIACGKYIDGLNALCVTYETDENIVNKIKKIVDQLNYIPKIN